MPVITIEGPQLNKEQKKQLVERFTETASNILKFPKGAFIVLIKENDYDNIGVGGVLFSERK